MTTHSRYNMETWALRDALRDALPRYRRTDVLYSIPRVARTGPQLFSIVVDEIGDIDERRMWRGLSWLLRRGIAVRVCKARATRVDPEDRGYIRGTGIEYPWDAEMRLAAVLSSRGRCTSCHGPAEPDRPIWMNSRCVACHWINHGEMAKARREAYIALGLCARCHSAPPAVDRRECDRCAGREADYRRSA